MPTQVPDLPPPVDLRVEITGTTVRLDWSQPGAVPPGYNLLVGPSAQELNVVTSQFPRVPPAEIGWALPRGTPYFVALQAWRNQGREYSATAVPVQVVVPTVAAATLSVDCSVARVNDLAHPPADGVTWAYDKGTCVAGTYHSWDMARSLNQIRGWKYRSTGIGSVLELSVSDGEFMSGHGDGPFPTVSFSLAPVDAVGAGATFGRWVDLFGSGQAEVSGGVYRSDVYGDDYCLDGIATGGSLTLVEVANLDTPGQGSFRIQGAATVVDPITVPEICTRHHCCWGL